MNTESIDIDGLEKKRCFSFSNPSKVEPDSKPTEIERQVEPTSNERVTLTKKENFRLLNSSDIFLSGFNPSIEKCSTKPNQ